MEMSYNCLVCLSIPTIAFFMFCIINTAIFEEEIAACVLLSVVNVIPLFTIKWHEKLKINLKLSVGSHCWVYLADKLTRLVAI